jgi:DNA replication and repair protein RecF
VFLVDGVDMGAFGSRGEQRMIAVALKLAEAVVIRALMSDSPVLLLDDILSELDPTRRQFVQEQIQGDFQTLITVADLSTCSDLLRAGAQQFRVERGALSQ